MRLSGKVAIVTGGAAGIGYAIAHRFAGEGAKVVIADVDKEGAMAAAVTIAQSRSGDTLGLAMDATDEDAVEAAVELTFAKYGTVDILVSNAGIQIISSIDKLSYSDWKKVTSVHLDGAFLTTRACLKRMYSSGRGGSIVYMGSVHSKVASVLKAPYVVSKHGLLGLCRTVAKEGAPHGVRANIICPSFVRTKLVEKQIPEQARVLGISEEDVIRKVMLKDTLDGQFTTTDEIAEVAVFLSSQESLAFTGQSLMVSHGWWMK
jgi:3-hydroxybutyrate dehydrogenase